jgi:hypothetical protein
MMAGWDKSTQRRACGQACSASCPRQVELTRRDRIEIRQHVVDLHHVCVFGVHVAQTDGMAGLAAVEAGFLGQHHTVVQAERIHHGRPHAARRRRTGDHHAVAPEQREVGGEVGAEKP